MNMTDSPIKAILFDCDGTLIDSEPSHYLAYKQILSEMGSDFPIEEYLQFVGKSDLVTGAFLGRKLGIDAESLIQKKRARYLQFCHAGLPLIEPTVQFLKSLALEKERFGIKLGVCSAANKTEVLFHIRHLGIESCLDVILSGENDLGEYSDPEGVNKPKPYIYLHAAKLLQIAPSECVVIEDSFTGVASGKSAGSITVAIPNESSKNQDFSGAHLKLNSFSGITVRQFFLKLLTIN